MNNLEFNKIKSVFFFGLILILGIIMLYIFQPFLYPIFWAAIIAVMFYPLYNKLQTLLKIKSFSSILSVLLVIVILFIPLTILAILLINESIVLYQKVSDGQWFSQVQGVSRWIETTPLAPYMEHVRNNWTNYAQQAAKDISVFLFNNLKGLTQMSLTFTFMLFVMFYTLFYFFKDGPKMLRRLMHLSPLGDQYEQMLYKRFTSTARATLKSTIIVGGIQGALGAILFWLTGIEGALIWGIIMTMFCIIPGLGSFIVWMPAAIIMLALGNLWQGIVIILVGALVISTIDNLLRPILVGKDIQMHPLVVLFSTLGGILIFGISGFVIGPVLAALFLSIVSIYEEHFKTQLNKN